ncbi:dTDP-4-dehydrorhamnose 3,5-epimerase [Pusillimonas noertemannii]|nr:dTDP-4-dehydrorhamnose 3,5-epimerase [Pusillimonas noertemannii]NYT67184.1 dTDP-4-dehydrorhamnose 3,5-epimerase [Pusillimonas noertemannii]TFL12616.1 dTDP-4-dehydrorhamnose 3,5-epimerase [Pusillimonas noertemannii]
MNVLNTPLADALIFVPKVHGDHRGFFFESFNQRSFEKHVGASISFVQDNHSQSSRGVIRGLHYQIRQAQGKLVRVVKGEVFDVAVDLRRSSRTFGKWFGTILSDENKHQFWIPPGFAHGFQVLSDSAEFLYKTTDYWAPEYERSVLWNDPQIGIQWPIMDDIILSEKDGMAPPLATADIFS